MGVDVEDTERSGETVEIADQFFSPLEAAALRALPADRQRARFFDYWTLKEAYIKARGMGLAIPLEQFSFLLDDWPAPIRVAFDPAPRRRRRRLAVRAAPRSAPRHKIAVGPSAAARLPSICRVSPRPTVPLATVALPV